MTNKEIQEVLIHLTEEVDHASAYADNPVMAAYLESLCNRLGGLVFELQHSKISKKGKK